MKSVPLVCENNRAPCCAKSWAFSLVTLSPGSQLKVVDLKISERRLCQFLFMTLGNDQMQLQTLVFEKHQAFTESGIPLSILAMFVQRRRFVFCLDLCESVMLNRLFETRVRCQCFVCVRSGPTARRTWRMRSAMSWTGTLHLVFCCAEGIVENKTAHLKTELHPLSRVASCTWCKY